MITGSLKQVEGAVIKWDQLTSDAKEEGGRGLSKNLQGKRREERELREPVLDSYDEIELSTLLILFLKQFEAAYLGTKSALETKYW